MSREMSGSDIYRHTHPESPIEFDDSYTKGEMYNLVKKSPGRVAAEEIIRSLNQDKNLDDAVAEMSLPFDIFDDPYWSEHPYVYQFGVMLRSFIYAELRGIRYHTDLADFLESHPQIAFRLGFEAETPKDGCPSLNAFQQPDTPHQTTLTRCANKRFLARTEQFITTVADEVEAYCRDHGHLVELTELWDDDPDTNPGNEEDELDPDGLSKQQIRRLVNELMRHICPHIDFRRGQSKTIRRNLCLEVIAHCSLTSSSVYNGGDVYEIYAKPGDEELPAGRTFFDHMEGLTTEQMLSMFNSAVESMIEGARDIGLYDRPVDIAIDVTTIQYTGLGKTFGYDAIADPDAKNLHEREVEEARTAIEKWKLEPVVGESPFDIKHANFDDPEKIAAARRVKDCVEWVNGTKKDDGIEYGFQFAAGAIAEKTCPMLFAIEPLNGRDAGDLRDHVRDFVERANEVVVVDSVYMDAYYAKSKVMNLFHYGHGFRTADVFDIDYVVKMPEHKSVRRQVLEERYTDNEVDYADGDSSTTICRNFGYGTSYGTETAHTTLVAVKKHTVNVVEDKVTDRTIFATNRKHADGGERSGRLTATPTAGLSRTASRKPRSTLQRRGPRDERCDCSTRCLPSCCSTSGCWLIGRRRSDSGSTSQERR